MTSNDAVSRKHIIFLDYTALLSDPYLLNLNHRDFSYWLTPSTMKMIEGGTDALCEAMRDKLQNAFRGRAGQLQPRRFYGFQPSTEYVWLICRRTETSSNE
jgi:hypothetical protein